MRISQSVIKKLIKNKGLSIDQALLQAGVSKTAYYSLTRKESILPKSLQDLAKFLQVKPSTLLEEESTEERLIRRLLKKLELILQKNPLANRENVWHTLLLLQEKPIERLNRGLLRAQNHIHK